MRADAADACGQFESSSAPAMTGVMSKRDVLQEREQIAGRHAAGCAEPPAEPDDDQHRAAGAGEQRGVEGGAGPREVDARDLDAGGVAPRRVAANCGSNPCPLTTRTPCTCCSTNSDHSPSAPAARAMSGTARALSRARTRCRCSTTIATADASSGWMNASTMTPQHEHRRRLDRPGQWAERGLERGDIGRRARHQLSGTHAVVERERQPLEVFVETAAQVVRDERGAFRRLVLAHRTGERRGRNRARASARRSSRDGRAGRRRRRCRWLAARRAEWRAPRPGRRTRPRVRSSSVRRRAPTATRTSRCPARLRSSPVGVTCVPSGANLPDACVSPGRCFPRRMTLDNTYPDI